jgi:hypothetical protein
MRVLGAVGMVVALIGCSSTPKDPKAQVRAAVAALEEAAEERDLGRVKDLVGEGYADGRGGNKSKLIGMLQLHFLRKKSIHIAQRIDRISFPREGRAEVHLMAGVAGTKTPDLQGVVGLKGNLFDVDFSFELEDDDWRLVGAKWRRATPADLLPGD